MLLTFNNPAIMIFLSPWTVKFYCKLLNGVFPWYHVPILILDDYQDRNKQIPVLLCHWWLAWLCSAKTSKDYTVLAKIGDRIHGYFKYSTFLDKMLFRLTFSSIVEYSSSERNLRATASVLSPFCWHKVNITPSKGSYVQAFFFLNACAPNHWNRASELAGYPD